MKFCGVPFRTGSTAPRGLLVTQVTLWHFYHDSIGNTKISERQLEFKFEGAVVLSAQEVIEVSQCYMYQRRISRLGFQCKSVAMLLVLLTDLEAQCYLCQMGLHGAVLSVKFKNLTITMISAIN